MSETALAEGELIYNAEQMEELPIGSVICEAGRDRYRWEKGDDGHWRGIEGNLGSGPYSAHSFSMDGYNKVFHRPGDSPPVPPPDTLLQYQWKFRENAISGAQENGVSMDATMKGLRLLGLDREWELGPEVAIKTLDDRLDIPTGTVIRNAGRAIVPSNPNYTLFIRKTRRQWVTLLGRSGLGRDGVIVEYPGKSEPPAWWTEVGDETSVTDVLNFKARAWRIGQQIKSEQSWCGTYEHVIARVGVTARSLREAQGAGLTVGDRVSQRDARRLPVGTLLIYRNDSWSNHWAVYQRDDTADNLTNTRRIAGHKTENAPALGHYQSSMMILSVPIEGYDGWIVDAEHAPLMLGQWLPIGTQFSYGDSPYIIAQDRSIVGYRGGPIPERGIHQARVFSSSPITITQFPTEEQA